MGKLGSFYYENGYHLMCIKGDFILSKVINDYLKPLKGKVNSNSLHKLDCFLRSNEFISTFKIGFKFKSFKDKTPPTVNRGDMTEAWICFLYDNYGEKKVKEYFYKGLKDYYNKNY